MQRNSSPIKRNTHTVAGTSSPQNGTQSSPHKYKFYFGWTDEITDEEWLVYGAAMRALRDEGIDFMLGGGFAQAAFTGRWRNTKDIDLYILPDERERAIDIITRTGLEDYYSRLPYDRNWIYRSVRNDVIVDLIWAMANQRSTVDSIWFKRAGEVTMREFPLKVAPIEEFLWCKLYIVQRDRCDWVDVMNLFYSNGTALNWEHLLWRLGEDWPLLQGVLTLYGWLHPERAGLLRNLLPQPLQLESIPAAQEKTWQERVRLLDSREWFGALIRRGGRLEI